MVALALTSGAYSSQSLTANAQRCINLYMEKNPDDAKANMPTAHYPRPGLSLLSQPPAPGRGRGLFGTNNGDLYGVIDQSVYYINPDWQLISIGNLLTDATTPVSIADNGAQAILVDGSPNGYEIVFPTPTGGPRTFAQISDPNFLGSTRADTIDSFLVLNVPGTNQWYSTQSDMITPFNALYLGVKTAWPDNVLCVVTCERLCWLFGPKKSEVWTNAGAVPFPFQLIPGNIIEQGCAATYSPAKMDTNVYWLSQSPEGDRMVMRGNSQLVAERISTHAIEAEWRDYDRIDDAIGSVYQVSGHSFYKLHFPTADKTWGFDEATGQWHEDNWIDINGVLHRARNTFCAFAYGKNVALDWATGALYQIDPRSTDDNGVPIVWIRSFPHLVNELKYVSYPAFSADVSTGLSLNTGDADQFKRPWSDGYSPGFGPTTTTASPELRMRMSRNGGYSYGNYRIKKLVGSGNYRTMQRYRGNGIARDAVFELSSTAQMVSAVNGAYVDPIPASS